MGRERCSRETFMDRGNTALALLIAVSRTDLPFVEFFVEQGLTGHWPGVSIALHILVEAAEKENFAAAVGVLDFCRIFQSFLG